MVGRLTSKSIEFAYSFVLVGVDNPQPAGVYVVETVEEQIDGLSFVAYRRLSTTIALRSGGKVMHARQITEIDPVDLAAALERDATASRGSPRS